MIIELAIAAQIVSSAPTTPVQKIGDAFEAGTVTYAPGESDPAGNHGYDVVLVPIDEGMTVEVENAPVTWRPGIPILISRGAPHRIANTTTHPIRFEEIRTVGDNLAGNDATVSSTGATIVRSVVGKYVRASVWRLERGGRVEWPEDVDQVLVGMWNQQTVLSPSGERVVPIRVITGQKHWENSGDQAIEFVRISRMVSR